MSFTYTKEGIMLQKLLNNENWTYLHLMLHNFCNYRGFSILDTQYLDLYGAMMEDFNNSRSLNCGITASIPLLQNWFVEFLKAYDALKITDLDRSEKDMTKFANVFISSVCLVLSKCKLKKIRSPINLDIAIL